MLRFRPESLTKLRERIPAALSHAYQVWDKAPIDNPAHVFDLESGLRLVVTRKVIDAAGPECLHVSVAIVLHSMLDELSRAIWKDKLMDHKEWLKRLVIGQFKELNDTPLEFLGFDSRGMPLFFGELSARCLTRTVA